MANLSPVCTAATWQFGSCPAGADSGPKKTGGGGVRERLQCVVSAEGKRLVVAVFMVLSEIFSFCFAFAVALLKRLFQSNQGAFM